MTENKKIIKAYIIGFVSSILLTVSAFVLTLIHVNSAYEVISHEVLIPAIICLALLQVVIQMVFFLHIGEESKPRWNLVFFLGTMSIAVLIVVASLWIMQHLNYNMSPQQMETYTQSQDGF